MDEMSIRTMVARRARELGSRVDERAIELEFPDAEAAPGCRLFRASWGAGEREGALAGLIVDQDAPDTHPARALAKIFRRWIETGGKLPDANHVATVCAYLLEPPRRHHVILDDADKIRLIEKIAWRSRVGLPQAIDRAGQPGIAFWWVGPSSLSRMQVYLGEDGRIEFDETLMRDVRDEGTAAL